MRQNKYFWIVVALLSGVIIYTKFLTGMGAVPLRQSLELLPDKIAGFSYVSSQTFSEAVIKNAAMDQYVMRYYQSPDGYTVGLYIGYYEKQTDGALIHSPKHCMPGSGWNFLSTTQHVIADATGQEHTINQLVLQKGMDKQLVHYWYQGRGRLIASEYLDKAMLIIDSALKGRSDGALVRITGPGKDLEIDLQRQTEFITALMPLLRKYLPD